MSLPYRGSHGRAAAVHYPKSIAPGAEAWVMKRRHPRSRNGQSSFAVNEERRAFRCARRDDCAPDVRMQRKCTQLPRRSPYRRRLKGPIHTRGHLVTFLTGLQRIRLIWKLVHADRTLWEHIPHTWNKNARSDFRSYPNALHNPPE
jgi:hypothetical protein